MSGKFIRDIRVQLTEAELEERKASMSENGVALVAWEAERKAVLAPIDAQGKYLKERRKELAEAINSKEELRGVEVEWFEDATQRRLIRLDTGDVLEQEPLDAEAIRAKRQQNLPLEEPPATPPTSEGSAPLAALPEHAGDALAGEAEEWQGGDIAPPAPAPAPRALPAGPQAGSTVDVEIVDEAAEHNRRETWRGLVLDALANRALAHGFLFAAVCKGVAGRGVGLPTLTEFRGLLASMVASQAVEVTDDGMYRRPDPAPKAKAAERPRKKGKRGRSGRKAAE